MSFGDSINVDQSEYEAFLGAMRASSDSSQIFLDIYVRHILTMETSDILCWLFIRLFDDFGQHIGNNLNYIFRRNYSCTVQNISFFICDTFILINDLPILKIIHFCQILEFFIINFYFSEVILVWVGTLMYDPNPVLYLK